MELSLCPQLRFPYKREKLGAWGWEIIPAHFLWNVNMIKERSLRSEAQAAPGASSILKVGPSWARDRWSVPLSLIFQKDSCWVAIFPLGTLLVPKIQLIDAIKLSAPAFYACGVLAIVLKDAVELSLQVGLNSWLLTDLFMQCIRCASFGRHLKHIHKINKSKFFDKLSSFRSYLIFECRNEHAKCSHHKTIMEALSIKLTNRNIWRWSCLQPEAPTCYNSLQCWNAIT